MDPMYRCCAGLEVHKETVAACVRRVDSAGRVAREVRTFGTMTGELLKLSDWLMAEGVEAAAMESTGVFWKPIGNILEGSLPLILVMSRFPTDQHLASWAAMCPGNRESAGKRQSGRTNHGNRWLRATLAQAAWAASHSKKTYLSAQYRRLAGRRGKKRAIIALGHTMLVMMYHMLRDGQDYQELGHDYLDKLQPHRLTRYLVKRLQSLGHEVILRSLDQAA